MYVDSHAHIDGEEFASDRDDVIRRAHHAGVTTILTIGTGDPHSDSIERAVDLAEQHTAEQHAANLTQPAAADGPVADGVEQQVSIYAAVGVHPHDAKSFDEAAAERLGDLVQHRRGRIIAWGEIGLDYHYDNSPRDMQRRVFARQLLMAGEAQLPVVIHSRDAEQDTIEILHGEWNRSAGGVMHCFSGSQWMAEQALELGFMISFAGNVTFKRAESLRDVARWIPLERLLIETDCPYLAPAPFRGRRNEPAYVVEVARAIGEARGGIAAEAIGEATTGNFRRFFKLPLDAGQPLDRRCLDPIQ